VGLGHGSKLEKGTHLQTVAQVQEKLLLGGYEHMVSDENLYNMAADMTEMLGFRDANKYFTDPSTVPPPEPPEPDAAEQAIQAQMIVEQHKAEIKRQEVEIKRFQAMAEAKSKEWAHEERMAELKLEGAKVVADDPAVNITGNGTTGAPG
jgi:hypothetical protein